MAGKPVDGASTICPIRAGGGQRAQSADARWVTYPEDVREGYRKYNRLHRRARGARRTSPSIWTYPRIYGWRPTSTADDVSRSTYTEGNRDEMAEIRQVVPLSASRISVV